MTDMGEEAGGATITGHKQKELLAMQTSLQSSLGPRGSLCHGLASASLPTPRAQDDSGCLECLPPLAGPVIQTAIKSGLLRESSIHHAA